jgi:microcystin degradation protein MlrC
MRASIMARIAAGGLQHETNTFAPQPATFDSFLRPGGWPALVEGAALPAAMAGVNLPVGGFIEAARDLGHEIAPLLWAAATPSGRVGEDAFERLAAMLLARLEQAEPFAAVYLDLHGAMVCEHLDDGEAELLGRVRRAIGDRLLVASLDLHANVSDAMVAAADLLIAPTPTSTSPTPAGAPPTASMPGSTTAARRPRRTSSRPS